MSNDPERTEDAGPSPDRVTGSRRSFRGPIVLIVVAMLCFGVIGAVALSLGGRASEDPRPGEEWHGTLIEPARDRPSFTLTDESGNPFDFAQQTRGRLTFLFFGYTNCPDICPITMSVLTSAIADLQGTAAQVVFVTTDPLRDSPERITTWLASFRFDVVGLTGTIDQLEEAQRAAGVSIAIPEAPDANGTYNVGHSGSILVYTPDDRQHLVMPSEMRQVDYMDDIRRITADPTWNTVGAAG